MVVTTTRAAVIARPTKHRHQNTLLMAKMAAVPVKVKHNGKVVSGSYSGRGALWQHGRGEGKKNRCWDAVPAVGFDGTIC